MAPPSDQDKPTLLTLPREIRDIIYDYVCEDVIVKPEKAPERTSTSNSNIGFMISCRQMYAEARNVYYRKTVFTFFDGPRCVEWLGYLPSEAITILGSVRIQYPTNWIFEPRQSHKQDSLKIMRQWWSLNRTQKGQWELRNINEALAAANRPILRSGSLQIQHGRAEGFAWMRVPSEEV